MNHDFISARELAERLNDSSVVVVDCRFSLADADQGRAEYRQSHIPGAMYADLNRDLSGPVQHHGGRHPLPDPTAFTRFASAIGIDSKPASLVVVYDDNRFAFCARLWWLLRYFGHDNVQVLDGGWAAWQSAELPVASGEPEPRSQGNFTAVPGSQPVTDREQLKQQLGDSELGLLDARDPDRFSGKTETVDPRAGHIPGAVNYPWQQLSDEAGFFKQAPALKEHWSAIAQQQKLVAYCGSGVTACANILGLRQIGRDDVVLYPGSWSDWSSHPADGASNE